MKNIFQSENCLSLDSMRMYKDGKLTARNAHAVEKHLLECSLCAEAFDSLDVRRMAEVEKVSTRVNRRLATYMNTPPRLGFFQRFGFAITAGTLILATGGGVALWMSRSEKQQITDSAQQKNNSSLVSQAANEQPETFTQELAENDPGNTGTETVRNPVNENSPAAAKKKETVREPENGSEQPVNNTRQPDPGNSNTSRGSENTTQTPVNTENNTRTPSTDPVIVKSSRLTMKVSANADDEKATGKMSDGQFVRTNKKKKNEQTLDQMPQFPDGDWNISDYVSSKFRPQKIDRTALKSYTAMVIVTVSSKGKVTNVELMRGIHKDIDAELMRVLQAMPAWTTGKGDIDATLVVTFE